MTITLARLRDLHRRMDKLHRDVVGRPHIPEYVKGATLELTLRLGGLADSFLAQRSSSQEATFQSNAQVACWLGDLCLAHWSDATEDAA